MVFTIKEKLKSFYIVSSVLTLLLLVSIYESSYIRNSETYSNVLENTETKGSFQFTRKLTFWGQNNERVDLENEDDTSVADEMTHRVRILCWILTHNTTIRTKSMAVMRTWGRRCTSIYFISDILYDRLPTVMLNNTQPGKQHLVFKSRDALDYLYQHHAQDSDWFLKADDDTYVIMENLRYLLDKENPDEPVAFGQQFHRSKSKWKYMTGGAGYVMSRAALEKFANRKRDACLVDKFDGTMEDIRISRCLHVCGVTLVNTTDRMGRQRFHHHTLTSRATGVLEKWYYKHAADPVKVGVDNLSLYPISFHHMMPADMLAMDATLYSIRRYGVVYGYHDINQ